MPAPLLSRTVLVVITAAAAALTAPRHGLAQGEAKRLDPAQFPPTDLFRELQLDAMACGRDNLAAPCTKTRQLVDPLMDHPLLSAACKDTLWSVSERAVVVPRNSYERREALNRESSDLMRLCRPATKPIGNGATQAKDEKKPGGLGGFLKGLGIGGGSGQP